MRWAMAAGLCAVSAGSLLAGCGDVKSQKIRDINFADGSQVMAISQKLTPVERADFNFYALNRTVGASLVPGNEITREDGGAPTTVGEAIDLAHAKRTEVDAEAKADADRTVKRNAIVDQLNPAIEKFNAMPRPEYGLPPARHQEWRELNAKIDKLEAQLAAFDAQQK